MQDNLVDVLNSKLNLNGNITPAMPGRIAPCCLCGKPYYVRPFIGAIDQICDVCYKLYKDCAKIVCSKCMVTICRVRPKILENGYYIRPMSVLHINRCNICHPGLRTSTIIEIDQFERITKSKKIILVR